MFGGGKPAIAIEIHGLELSVGCVCASPSAADTSNGKTRAHAIVKKKKCFCNEWFMRFSSIHRSDIGSTYSIHEGYVPV